MAGNLPRWKTLAWSFKVSNSDIQKKQYGNGSKDSPQVSKGSTWCC